MGLNNTVPNTTVQNNSSGNNYNLILTCDVGYEFDLEKENLYATYTDLKGYGMSAKREINTENTVATFTADDWNGNINDNCFIWGATKEKTQSLDVTNSVPNTTFKYEIQGANVVFTLTCNEGYVFDGLPKVFFYTNSGNPSQPTFTVNGTNNVATATCADADVSKSFEISGNTVQSGSGGLNVTNNIANTTFEVAGNVITLICNEGYIIDGSNRPQAEYIDSDGDPARRYFVAAEDNLTATVTLLNIDSDADVTLSGTVIQGGGGISYIVDNQLVNVRETLPDRYPAGEISITLTAVDGTEFNPENPPQVLYHNSKGTTTVEKFIVSGNKQTASLTFTPDADNGETLEFTGGAEPITVIGENYGSINVYLVTLDNLNEFAKKRFFKEVEDPETGQRFEYVDLGQYVNRIKRIFVQVPEGADAIIQCGNYDTGIVVKTPTVDRVTLDFRNVTIPAHNKDLTDYESEIQLFLPFKGFVSVPSDMAGKTVNLKYIVNVLTGNGVAVLSCDGVPFIMESVQPNTDIIYRLGDTVTVIGSDDWNEQELYGKESFVLVKWYESSNKDNICSDYRNVNLADLTGFVKLTDVSIISTPEMLADEQKMIYDALENGVYM